MLYAKVENGQITAWPLYELDVRKLLHYISLPQDFSKMDLRSYGIYSVPEAKPPTSTRAFYKVVLGDPAWEGDQLVRTWVEVEIPQDEINKRFEDIRAERNSKLYKSDWTQLADAPLTKSKKQQWAAYRQSLRDLMGQFNDPYKINWPQEP